MKISLRTHDNTFEEKTEVEQLAIDLGENLAIDVLENRDLKDLSPTAAVYLRVRGLEIRVREDGSVNVSNIGRINVGSPITLHGR